MSETLHVGHSDLFERNDRIYVDRHAARWWRPFAGKRVVLAASGGVVTLRGYHVFDWLLDVARSIAPRRAP